jgi:hypothetical protein
MNVTTIEKAYEMAVDAMMQATPEMPREIAEIHCRTCLGSHQFRIVRRGNPKCN